MPVNHIVLASGAAVAISIAVATALVIYESPEFQRYTEDFRRRIALAVASLGNRPNQEDRQPRFNRPEDAQGFMTSRRGEAADPGVDADEESRRRQREELMYWNSVRLQNQAKVARQGRGERSRERGSTFDDFLKPDGSAEQGAFVVNTGADVQADRHGLRRRGDVAKPLSASLYANPFADEHHIDPDEMEAAMAVTDAVPGRDPMGMSDLYSATTRDLGEAQFPPEPVSVALIDVGDVPPASPSRTESVATLERRLADDEYMTAGQENRQDAYASIQAWAQESSRDFYSPLPATPAEPASEPELVSDASESDGELTPTDSMSLAGSGVDVANDVMSSRDGHDGRTYDVLSESDGLATPASWSEVGSQLSESDANAAQPMHS